MTGVLSTKPGSEGAPGAQEKWGRDICNTEALAKGSFLSQK